MELTTKTLHLRQAKAVALLMIVQEIRQCAEDIKMASTIIFDYEYFWGKGASSPPLSLHHSLGSDDIVHVYMFVDIQVYT